MKRRFTLNKRLFSGIFEHLKMAGTWYIVKRTEMPAMMDSKCERIEFQVAGSNILSSNFSYVK